MDVSRAAESVSLHESTISELAPVMLYRLLALRVDIFVVEQACAYRELDGRELEPGAMLVWAEREPGEPIATLRLLADPDGSMRIGRVATVAGARSAGIATRLMHRAIDLASSRNPGGDIVLDAQAQLEVWYHRFGFVRAGDSFDEDGIPHVPMRRIAS